MMSSRSMAGVTSLRGRVFLATSLLTVLSIGVAILLVNVRVTREAEDRLQREIVTTSALVDELVATRLRTFTQMARLIAQAPVLEAAVDTNDPPTVQDIANGYRDQVQSGLLVVTNKAGGVLAALGTTSDTAELIARQPSVALARAGGEGVALLPEPAGMLQLVSVPIAVGLTRRDILGTLSAGFVLDDKLASDLKRMTGSDVAFTVAGRVLASTLPKRHETALAALTTSHGSTDVSLGGEDYVALPRPLTAVNTHGQGAAPLVLILRSRADDLRNLRSIHAGLTLIAVVAVVLATLLSFAVARSITRPLAAITDTMRDVARTGDLTRKITVEARGWADEDARLLAATFNTLTDSIARFQREFSQRERLSSLGRLSTVIAHEIRNPLMIIKGALHTLRHGGADGAREAITDIDEEVNRLNRIVNDVLDFSRPIRFELGPAALEAVCRESASAATAVPGGRVRLEIDPGLPDIVTDAERVRTALVNILENARQAGGGGEITLSVHADGGVARVIVADSGGGIAADDLPRIFDPYFTTKRGGTGLGLPIAKNIIEGLGGSIMVTSGPDGTAFQIDLPLAPASAGSIA